MLFGRQIYVNPPGWAAAAAMTHGEDQLWAELAATATSQAEEGMHASKGLHRVNARSRKKLQHLWFTCISCIWSCRLFPQKHAPFQGLVDHLHNHWQIGSCQAFIWQRLPGQAQCQIVDVQPQIVTGPAMSTKSTLVFNCSIKCSVHQ